MLIETLAFTFLFLSPNEHPRTRSDQGGRGGGIVRHLAWRSHSKEPDVSQGADRDIATQTQGHWPATAGPGSKLFMGLGRSSQHHGGGKEKASLQKSSNHLKLSQPYHLPFALVHGFCFHFVLFHFGFVFPYQRLSFYPVVCF